MESYDDKRENYVGNDDIEEKIKLEYGEYVKNKLSPYKEIAKDALMSFNGLSEEEAEKKVRESSNEELELEVYAQGSIGYALEGFQKFAQENFEKTEDWELPEGMKAFPDKEIAELKEAIMDGPIDSRAFKNAKRRLGVCYKEGYKAEDVVKTANEMIVSVLSNIHDGWVKDNQKKFNAREQKHQHMPVELIGWDEAKKDLLFLKPILFAMNIGYDEKELEQAYNERVSKFMESNQIESKSDLVKKISEGAAFYPALEGQDEIIEALKDPSFVEERVVSAIEEKGIGKNEEFSKVFDDKQETLEEIETLRQRKQTLEQEAKTLTEAEILIDQKENNGQTISE